MKVDNKSRGKCERVKILPVLHEDVAEGAVEDGVDEVGQAQVEDQQVGDRSHPQVALNIFLFPPFIIRLTPVKRSGYKIFFLFRDK